MNYPYIYFQLVCKRIEQPISKDQTYCECHHIVPKSENGTNNADNIVNLTAREHYIAHLLLAKIYDDDKMWSAITMMKAGNDYCKRNNIRISNRIYEIIRKNSSLHISKRNKGRQSWLGKRHSEKTRMKMRRSHSGQTPWNKGKQNIYSDETIQKMSNAHIGKQASDATKEKLSRLNAGENNRMYGKRGQNSPNFGKHWYNNGVKNIFVKEKPDDSWKDGRTSKTYAIN